MTEPQPEPRGERQRIPPKPPTAVGLMEPDSPGSFSWRLVFLIGGAVLIAAGILYLVVR